MQSREVTITNKRGLHARASAKFAGLTEQYTSKIKVSKDGMEVNGTSIMGLMMLAAAPGDTIHIKAVEGEDMDQAVDALVKLVEDKFYEDA